MRGHAHRGRRIDAGPLGGGLDDMLAARSVRAPGFRTDSNTGADAGASPRLASMARVSGARPGSMAAPQSNSRTRPSYVLILQRFAGSLPPGASCFRRGSRSKNASAAVPVGDAIVRPGAGG